MQTEPALAFAGRGGEPPGLEIAVNFGVFAGRDVTPAEIDELARRLLSTVDAVSLISEHRYEISAHAEATLHQIRVEVARDLVPADDAGRAALQERLVTEAQSWAQACIAERHAEVSDL